MKKEYVKILDESYKLEICVDYNASGKSVDEDEVSPDIINYFIKDCAIRDWHENLIFDYVDEDDSEWYEDENISWFEYLIYHVINEIAEEELEGSWALNYWSDEDLKIGALLKDEDDNIIEEAWNIDLRYII